jgi:hypothetical protein
MPINPYINFYNAANEQNLLESLIIESIRMYGFDTHYLVRTLDDFDEIFRESPASSYNTAYTMEVYLKSNLKFDGDGKFMSGLGLEIRDQTTFTVAQSVFKQISGMERPREGDLMFLPLDKKVYEIKFVQHQSVFYQLGKLMVWDLETELLEYNGERFNTGIPEIDIIPTFYDMDDDDSENGIEDWSDQSEEIQAVTDSNR